MKGVDVSRIASYIASKAEYERFFSWLFERIGEQSRARLAVGYPHVRVWNARKVIREMLAEIPTRGTDFRVDWVAFDFEGIKFWDLHVGVVFDTERWPVTYDVGLHVRDDIWPTMQSRIADLDWTTAVGLEGRYYFSTRSREHKHNDPSKEFDFSNPEGAVEEIVERVVRYYAVGSSLLLGGGPNGET